MAGRRKKRSEEHENHERWLVSYADFITLLFAFFVVMYAISSVNEGKYRVLSDSLVSAFRNVPGDSSGAQVQINPHMNAPMQAPDIRPASNPKVDEAKRAARSKMRNMAREIKEALATLVKNGQVRVTEGARGVTIEINASVLFPPGDARLGADAIRALTAVAVILAPSDFPIIVEGHTDNVPISTPMFPSNWELSSTRASSVVRLFIENRVAASRLTAIGYADQRPIADNTTPEGRARNRRVAITIESPAPDDVVEVPILTGEQPGTAATPPSTSP
jgi:chemotaxis protein MotB